MLLRLRTVSVALLSVCLAANLWSQASFIKVEIPSERAYAQNTEKKDVPLYYTQSLAEPLTIQGSCSKDVVKITVDYYSFDDSSAGRGTNIADEDWSLNESYTLKKFRAGDESFVYRIFEPLGDLKEGSNRYVFTATLKDKRQVKTSFILFYTHYAGERAKPVIYLYPTREQDVFVNVTTKEGLSKTIPEIGGGWKVKADPQGKITTLADGRQWPYLFWEGRDSSVPPALKEGFVVERSQIPSFFSAKLAYLGLNAREIADFLDFWTPLLKDSPWYAFVFVPQAQLDAEAPLTIVPTPDSILRVYFLPYKLSSRIALPEQKLVPGKRVGFTVTEWGGRRSLP